ncbi:sensor histidine kinase [Candidatus Arthromitus sp. SFB-rat-Yit]|uniref:sensor histidine kinase n=1 Tax=Candidatus Arthromitus sp. SFB-rat-Yit TaxID=1041504 RepID=UPI000227A4E2|nr:HAMP domain-containing sensor histidine kinase [Candidatus Arthromitus sp. SFB-rat-Yit]BAK80973.1 putative sensory transduction histidine kinase [Candidatus Arthromitus sp. SFB-rat-Yit]
MELNEIDIINSFNDIVLITDLNNIIKSYNKKAYESFSFDKDFLKGKSITDFIDAFEIGIHDDVISDEDFHFVNKISKNILNYDTRTVVFKRVFKRKELFFKLGIYEHKLYGNEVVGNIYILTDITDIYMDYRDLSKSNESMRNYIIDMKGLIDIKHRLNKKKHNQFIHINNIINNLHDGIIVVDNMFSEIYCNDVYKNTFDFTAREFLSLKFLDNYKVDAIGNTTIDIREFLRNIKFKNEKRTGQFLFKNIEKNIEKYFQITLNTIDYHDNSKLKYHNIIIFSDITQIKTQELLKDDFFNMVSHELRTPITLIKSSLQALENLCRDEVTIGMKKYLNMMNKNSSRLLKLINNILDLSKAESGYMLPIMSYFDIVIITEDIVTSINLHANHKKNIKVIFEPNVEEEYLYFDKEMYEKILLNLLSNAIKFTPNNKMVYVNLIINSDNFVLKVRDQGIGIPKDKLNGVFDKFNQVSSVLSRGAEGSGIGLSIVKRFVDILGGKIVINSDIGIGTEFILTFNKTIIDNDFEMIEEDILINDDVSSKVDIHFSDIYS